MRDIALLVSRRTRDRAAMLGYMQRILEVLDEGLLYHQKPFTLLKLGAASGDVYVISNGDGARFRFSEISVACSSSLTGYFELVGERVTNYAQLSATQNNGASVGDVRLNSNQYSMGNFSIVVPAGCTLQFVVSSTAASTFALCGNLEFKPQTGTELYRGRGF